MATESQALPNSFLDVIACLTERREEALVRCVTAAYRQGCSTEDLRAAIDIARYLQDVPAPLLRRAGEVVDHWAWIDARRRGQASEPAAARAEPPVASERGRGPGAWGQGRAAKAGVPR